MSKFKFIDGDLPEVSGRPPSGLLDEFAEALRARPNQWAEYPNRTKTSSARARASEIRHHSFRAPPPLREGFDARIHNDVLYVRFIGGES